MELAFVAAVAALALLSRRSSAPALPAPEAAPAEAKPAAPTVADVVAGAAPVVSTVVAAGKGVATSVANVGAAVAGAVAGVSAGFIIVGALWGVALIAGIVAGKVLAPEMDRRKTLPAWLTSEPWGIPWRAAREFWLAAILSKLTGFVRRDMRWPGGDGRYGDLKVQGEITFLVGGETEPPADRFAFYDWLAWARARYTYPRDSPGEKEIRDVENSAHVLARHYGRAFLITSRAIAQASGQSAPDESPLAPLTPENTLPIGAGSLAAPMSAPVAAIADTVNAIAAGVGAGTGVARVMYGAGGAWLLDGVSRSRVALDVATALRAAGFAWVTSDGPAVVFGQWGRVEMPGGAS